MNKKGSYGMTRLILVAGIAILVGAIFFQATADQIGQTNSLQSVENQTVTFATTGVTLKGIAVNPSSSMIVTNATGGELVNSANYTVANKVILSDGSLGSTITPVSASTYKAKSVNISYSYEPIGYIEDGASTAVVNLVLIFAGLAVAAVAIGAAFSPEFRATIGFA